ncbi:hypothetical protein XENOCAPTIV_008885 [Xenoophorus captivus]|uniref:Uncharacterized protein n=1 Tax=Xenoophorus captivus TaxID=1517983 RepID=A0ABV0QRJ2_9TELE
MLFVCPLEPFQSRVFRIRQCNNSTLMLVGTQQWTTMDTHSNKTSYRLTVLKPDTTYQVKVLTQCLNKLHKTNEMITIRTPEGRECHMTYLHFNPTVTHTVCFETNMVSDFDAGLTLRRFGGTLNPNLDLR